jgi:ribosomal-protein-alanine N-acetyltransferase
MIITGASASDGIVPALKLHAAVLATLHEESFPREERWSADEFASLLEMSGVFGFLAISGAAEEAPPCGMVLARVAADEAEILTIAVAPAARRLGHGRRLITAACLAAARAGARMMFLEVSAANDAARELYARGGFACVGRRARYYRDKADALMLRAELSAP